MPQSDDSLPPTNQTLQRAFEALVATLTERGIRYAIIGGLATLQHTRIRTTDDIDALLAVPQIALPGLFEALRDRGFNVNVETSIREFRDYGMTSIQFEKVIVDLLGPVIPTFSHILDRAISARVFGQTVRVSSAEGLILLKLVAMRPQDEADIQDLLAVYGSKLDLDFVRTEFETFSAPDDPRREKFEGWVRDIIRA